MFDNFQDEEEIELSLDDLHELSDMNKAKEDLANSMREALIYGWYATAFLYAEKLRKYNYGRFYSEYSDEINECRIICAAISSKKVYCLGPDFSDYINSFIDQDDDYIDVDLIADQLVHLWETASVLYF